MPEKRCVKAGGEIIQPQMDTDFHRFRKRDGSRAGQLHRPRFICVDLC